MNLRNHVASFGHYPWSDGANSGASVSSSGQLKRKRRDPLGPSALGPNRSDPGPATSSSSSSRGGGATPTRGATSSRQLPQSSQLRTSSPLPARKKARLSSAAAAPAGNPPLKNRARENEPQPEERKWKPSVVPVSAQLDDDDDDDVIIM